MIKVNGCPVCGSTIRTKYKYNREQNTTVTEYICGHIITESIADPMSTAAAGVLQSTGIIREFPSGSVRDSTEGKPPMELLPWELLERLAFHYGKGGEKYGENNWRRGQPDSAVLGSVHRHISKYTRNELDEDHLAAAIWGLLTLMNNQTYHQDNPLIRDILDWYDENGKPTGKGSYKQKLKDE